MEESPGNIGHSAPERGDVRESMLAKKKITARSVFTLGKGEKVGQEPTGSSGDIVGRSPRELQDQIYPESFGTWLPVVFFNLLGGSGRVGCLAK